MPTRVDIFIKLKIKVDYRASLHKQRFRRLETPAMFPVFSLSLEQPLLSNYFLIP